MAPFPEEVLRWARLTAGHIFLMFWWIWVAAVALTAVGESLWADGVRRRLLDRPGHGWRTVGWAVGLGVLSPPSRRRIFRQARALLGAGVSGSGVLAYLVSAQSLLVWFLLLVVGLGGPQPALGQGVATAVALAVLLAGAARTPEALWARARDGGAAESSAVPPGAARRGPLPLRLAASVAGQLWSLWWPLLFGFLGVGFFLALGRFTGGLSLGAGGGPLVQVGNAAAGLLLAYLAGAPLVGNALLGAGLWKAGLVSYAGLSAFYLGTVVMPFVLPRYYGLFGAELAGRLLPWLAGALLAGALAATAWWWGLDGLAGLLGVREAIESLLHSTLRPSDVPWFHHWFAPGI